MNNQTDKSYLAALEIGYELVSTGETLLSASHQAFDAHRIASLALAAKALKNYQAVLTLCSHGFGEAALVVVRGLFEDVVNLAYISQEPGGRAQLFAEFNIVEKKRLLANLERAGLETEQEEADWQANWEAEYQRLRPKFLTQRGEDAQYWSGLNVRQMCEAVDETAQPLTRPLLKTYHLLYVYVSQYTHGGSSLAAGAFVEGPGPQGSLRALFRPSDSEVGEALKVAFGLAVDMLKLYCRAWEIPGTMFEELELKERGTL